MHSVLTRLISILVFILLFISYSHGQYVFKDKFSDCEVEGYHADGKEAWVEYELEDLLKDIISNIEPKTLNKIRGQLAIQVYIDSKGNHCCLSSKSTLNRAGQKVDFKAIINEHTNWGIPIKYGVEVNASAMLAFAFYRPVIIIQRRGYTKDDGWIVIQEYVYGKH